jgi:hypothetical protein
MWDVTKLSLQRLQGFALKLKHRDFEAQMAEYLGFTFGVSMDGIFSQNINHLAKRGLCNPI